MQINMKYNYPAWKWVATLFFFFPFILGILQKQAFHFHPLTEDIPSYSLMFISGTQKLLLIIDWKIPSLLPADWCGCEVFPSWGSLAVDWWAKPLSQPRGVIGGCPCCGWHPGVFPPAGPPLARQLLELVVAVPCCWLASQLLSWACGTWTWAQSLLLAVGPWPCNLAPTLGRNEWARLLARPKGGTPTSSQPTELQHCSGPGNHQSFVGLWNLSIFCISSS